MIWLPIVQGGSNQRAVSLVTYNIGYDDDAWVMAAGERVERIGAQFAEFATDIFALQEVIYRGDRAEVEGFARLRTGWHWYAEPHNKRNHYCNMLVSAFPFVEGSHCTCTIVSPAGRNDRVNISAKVRTPAGIMRVWSIHTRFEEAKEGTKQTLRGVKLVADSEPDVPYAIMGDFNTGRSNVMEIAKDVGLQLDATHVGRIDHILVHGLDITAQHVAARPGVPGEHDPVFATVTR